MSSSSGLWYLYIIRGNDDSLYTGITIDVKRRFEEHSNQHRGPGIQKGAKALRGKCPLSLELQIPIGSRSKAAKLEYRVKRLDKYLKEALVRGDLSISSLETSNDTDD
ncbi:MAG: GIY-YIG nuclease family protein [Pseudomonadota bacterium]|nr:GIY-YIG nuclease family protein [Pseudomonadota bacterium]